MIACIGSTALKYRCSGYREPLDLDIVCSYQDLKKYCVKYGKISSFYPIDAAKKMIVKLQSNSRVIEAEMAWDKSSAQKLLELIHNDSGTVMMNDLLIPSIDVLYMLKMSHRYLKNSPHFLKTMEDIHLLRSLGAKIKHKDFYRERKEQTYNYAHPKLNQSKENFFSNDNVNYVFDHDEIHEIMKHYDRPLYNYFKADEAEVFCSKEKFFNLPYEMQIAAVLEETYVLALERSQIPFKDKVSSDFSFNYALEKVCTSITSGWFREFAWENYQQVKSKMNINYAEFFFEQVDCGFIKPKEG